MTADVGLISFDILADADDLFKMIGPLLIFGFYIAGALAKGWAKGRQQDSEEKEPSELTKAVQRRSRQIHQRQVGTVPQTRTRRSGQPQIPRTVDTEQPVEPPAPVRQPSQKGAQFHTERLSRSVEMKKRFSRKPHQPPSKLKSQDLKSALKPSAARPAQPKPRGAGTAPSSLSSLLRQPQDLRTAVILKEILDKPLALRDI